MAGSTGVGKDVAARTAFLIDPVEIRRGPDRGRPCGGEESGEAGAERFDFAPVPVASAEARIEHPIGRQAPHLDEPIDNGTSAADGEFARIERQRHDSDINALCQTPVEAHLELGVAMPGSQGRQIDDAVALRLFQLVDAIVGQENPGEMGFDTFDPRGSLRIRRGCAQKCNLAADIDTLTRAAAASVAALVHPPLPEWRSRSAASWRSGALISTG